MWIVIPKHSDHIFSSMFMYLLVFSPSLVLDSCCMTAESQLSIFSFFVLFSSSSSPVQDESRWDRLCRAGSSGTTFSHWIRRNRVLVALDGSAEFTAEVPLSQKILIVQELGVLACFPKTVQAEVEVHLNHLFAYRRKGDQVWGNVFLKDPRLWKLGFWCF